MGQVSINIFKDLDIFMRLIKSIFKPLTDPHPCSRNTFMIVVFTCGYLD